MGRINIYAKGLVALLLLSVLSGCYSWLVKPYGQVAADADPVRPDRQAVYIPPNAPSILNGHWVKDEGHQGIDIVSDVGTPVIAPASGVVTSSYFEPMYGNTLMIDHGKDADGYFIRGRYVHLDKRLVKTGDQVRRGEQIGSLGRTGLLSGGIPHMHYEVQLAKEDKAYLYESKNPHLFWMDGAGIITCFDSSEAYPEQPFRTTYPVPCQGIAWE